NGMEMGLLALAALLAVHALYFGKRRAVAAAALAVLVATRFEGAFYAGFMLAPLLLQRRPRRFARWLAFVVAVFAALELARWLAFGALLPNTVYAKTHAPYRLDAADALRSSLAASVEVLAMFAPGILA